jgi:tRNA1(Val) A37 N6-methylase TrmN6
VLFQYNVRNKLETKSAITKHMKKQSDDNSEYSGLDELLNTEVMKNYNSFIVSMAMTYASDSKTVIDFGAGIGTLSLIFRHKFSIRPLCLEIDKTNKDYLEKRGFEIGDDLSTIENKVDLIFSSNVL